MFICIGGVRGCDVSICLRRVVVGIFVCIVVVGGVLFVRSIESFRIGVLIYF